MAALGVEASIAVYLRLEGMRVAVFYSIHCHLTLLIVVLVRTVDAIAVGPAALPEGEAVAVELEALRLLAVAGRSPGGSRFVAFPLLFALAARFK